MNPKFVVIWLFALYRVVFSETYYINCENGNDQNSGTSTSSAWKTSSAVENANWNAGDNYLVGRGCTFGKLHFYNIHGTSSSPITIGAYGDSNKDLPTFSGAVSINPTSWTYLSSQSDKNIYYTDLAANIPQLFVDDEIYLIARYPKTAPFENGWIYSTEDSFDNYVNVPAEFLASMTLEKLENTRIVARVVHWALHSARITGVDWTNNRLLVTSYAGNALVWTYGYQKDYGIFMLNRLWMMEDEKTWVYDESIGRLYVYFEQDKTPSDVTVQYPGIADDTILSCYSCSHIVYENLKITYPKSECMRIGGSDSITVRDCELLWGFDTGLGISTSHNLVIQNNLIAHSLITGISAWDGSDNHDEFTNCLFYRNDIVGVGEYGGSTRYLMDLDTTENSIFPCVSISGSDHVFRQNDISYCGRDGIGVGGTRILFEENYIHDVGMNVDDIGMMYLYGGDRRCGHHTVRRNLGIKAHGNPYGTPSRLNLPERGYIPAQGIYCDDMSVGNVIEENTIIDVCHGFQLHDSQECVVRNNIAFQTWCTSVVLSEDSILGAFGETDGWARDNEITGNILISDDAVFSTLNYLGGDTSHTVSSVDNNYVKSYGNDWFVYHNSGQRTSFSSLNTWKQATGYDTNSKVLGDGFFETVSGVFEEIGQNLIVNGDFNESITGWYAWPGENFEVTHDPLWGGSYKATYIDVMDNNYKPAISQNEMDIEKGKSYVVKFKAQVEGANDRILARIGLNREPWTNSGFERSFDFSAGVAKNVEVVYAHNGDSMTGVRLDFSGGVQANVYRFDDIEVKETHILHEYDAKANDFSIFYNEKRENHKVRISGTYFCDKDGGVVRSLDLKPREGVVLVNCFCNRDGVCNNRESAFSCKEDCGSPGGFAGLPQGVQVFLYVLISVVSFVGVLLVIGGIVAVVIIALVIAKKRKQSYENFDSEELEDENEKL